MRLAPTETGGVEVVAFDTISHGKVLADIAVKETERKELIAITLRRFIEQNELNNDQVIISVPSQNSFARFVNLPPVEQKRIPEIVKFEASQQIPFDLSEVEWDWQLMEKKGGSENKVGIFAIKSEVVNSLLEYFEAEDITVTGVQMAPMALYNYAVYDRPELADSDDKAVIILDIGAENTDLVVCTRSSVWQRCIALGGNTFTMAIVNTFKLSFHKAEKLKRTAPMSKYARQIFHAMRPVYSDLASEIQRSLNFYTSSNPNVKLIRVIAIGGGTKLRGLLKYLKQSLQLPVERPDSFKRLAIGPEVSEAKFHENAPDLGVVYGLGLQALGLGKIETNLLPRTIAKSMVWASKAKFFTAAAILFLLVSALSFARTYFDKITYARNENYRREVEAIIREARTAENKLSNLQRKDNEYEAAIKKKFELFAYRAVVPLLYQTIISQLPNEQNNPEQAELYKAFAAGDAEKVKQLFPRKQRKQLFVTEISVSYADDVASIPIEFGGFKKAGYRRKLEEQEKERKRREADLERIRSEYEVFGMEMPDYVLPGLGMPGQVSPSEQPKPGFVVSIAGYSPYENIRELLDPRDVENDTTKWGFVTRLLHLDQIMDGNSPFELLGTSPENFQLEIGEVDLENAEMPAGIGVVDTRTPQEGAASTPVGFAYNQVLKDPMTGEIISKVAVLDEQGKPKYDSLGKIIYEVNDHWFTLKLKFHWKDAPVAKTAGAKTTTTPGFSRPAGRTGSKRPTRAR